MTVQTRGQGVQNSMAAQLIPVGVYALDQVDLSKSGQEAAETTGLAALASALRPNAGITEIRLREEEGGLTLAAPVMLGREELSEGVPVTVEGAAGVLSHLLVRVEGRPVGLAPAGAGLAATAPELLAAFVAGTLIDTPDGPRPVESLGAGDRVTTLANGSPPLVWVGRRRVLPAELLACPGLRPLCLPKGSVGNDRPFLVSPRQRVLIDDWRAEVYFGEDRVLVAAEALADAGENPVPLPVGGVDYVMLLCDRHEILLAEGALSESFHPGETGLAALTPEERASLAAVVPEGELTRRRAAYPIVRTAEARAMRLSG